ncbi:N-acyl-D-glutamate deacylase [subsurface metagenome]
MKINLIIRNGIIIDGTGKSRYESDIGITDGKIVEIGKNIESGDVELCAKNLIVSPGVIDIHAHSDATVYLNPSFESKIFQGITTEVWGNCGQSFAPILNGENREIVKKMLSVNLGAENLDMDWDSFREYLKSLPDLGMNVVPLIGHAILRANVMGRSHKEPTDKEMEKMKVLLKECLDMGAYGMSTGLEYAPEYFSTENELIALCEVLAKHNAFYATHIRNENENLWASVNEALIVSRKSGCPVHISHLKLGGSKNWGKTKHLLARLIEAKNNGVYVTWDVYPYTAWGGSLKDLLPTGKMMNENSTEIPKNSGSGKRLREEITQKMKRSGSSWNKIVIARASKSYGIIGKNIQEIAEENKEDVLDTFFRILLENNSEVKILSHDMNLEDVEFLLKHPDTIIATDSHAIMYEGPLSEGSPHPRYCGSIPKVLRYAREGLFSFEEAVRKMTSLPADRIGLMNRGRIKVGAPADLMIFNPNTVRGNATYENPVQRPTGIDYVLVNGHLIINKGVHSGALKGEILKSD